MPTAIGRTSCVHGVRSHESETVLRILQTPPPPGPSPRSVDVDCGKVVDAGIVASPPPIGPLKSELALLLLLLLLYLQPPRLQPPVHAINVPLPFHQLVEVDR
jgi:hypothetical protein